MKKIFTLLAAVILSITAAIGQCSCLFSYAAYFNTVNFINQSTVSNAHYFWNFGDGTGSNMESPIHTFPGTGDYMVTLFALDTISNCSSYYEYWVDVTKYSTDVCQPSISDSIYTSFGGTYLNIFNISSNCNGYQILYDGGIAQSFSSGLMPIMLNTIWETSAFYIVCRGQYFDIHGNLNKEAYKTSFHNYSGGHNYGDCSANFEFTVVSRDSSNERILFKAMNKAAKFYEWFIIGFGNPIYSNYDTVSQLYPSNVNELWVVGLVTQGSGGCRDTIWQDIIVGDSSKTVTGVSSIRNYELGITVFPNPASQNVTVQLVSEKEQDMEFTLYNLLGEQVYSETVKENIGTVSKEISLSLLPSGDYILQVRAGNNIYHSKITKLQ